MNKENEGLARHLRNLLFDGAEVSFISFNAETVKPLVKLMKFKPGCFLLPICVLLTHDEVMQWEQVVAYRDLRDPEIIRFAYKVGGVWFLEETLVGDDEIIKVRNTIQRNFIKRFLGGERYISP